MWFTDLAEHVIIPQCQRSKSMLSFIIPLLLSYSFSALRSNHNINIINHECIMSCCCWMLKSLWPKTYQSCMAAIHIYSWHPHFCFWLSLKQSSIGNSEICPQMRTPYNLKMVVHFLPKNPPSPPRSYTVALYDVKKITFVYLGSTREDYTSDCPLLYLLIIASSIR